MKLLNFTQTAKNFAVASVAFPESGHSEIPLRIASFQYFSAFLSPANLTVKKMTFCMGLSCGSPNSYGFTIFFSCKPICQRTFLIP